MVKIIKQINTYMILTSTLFLAIYCIKSLFFITAIPLNILILAALLSLSFQIIKLKLSPHEYENLEKFLYISLTFLLVACITYKYAYWGLRQDVNITVINMIGQTAWLVFSIIGIISLVLDNSVICYLKFKPLMLFKNHHFLSYITLLTVYFFCIDIAQRLRLIIPWSANPLTVIFTSVILWLSYLLFREPIKSVFKSAIRFSNYIEIGIYSLVTDSRTINDSLKEAIDTNDSTTTDILSRYANYENTKKGLLSGILNSNYSHVRMFSETSKCSPDLINLSLAYAIETNRIWALNTIGSSKKTTSMNINMAIFYALEKNKQDAVCNLINLPKANEETIELSLISAITKKNIEAVDIILRNKKASKI